MKSKKTKVIFTFVVLSVAVIIVTSFYILNGILSPSKATYSINEDLVEEELARAQELKQILEANPPNRMNVVAKINPTFETGLVFDDVSQLKKSELVRVMHEMTHQKISADKKYGAIPMTHNHIREVRDYLELARKKNKLNLNDYTKLGRIIERWEQADFSTIDEDQDYILKGMKAKIGYSNGLATLEEELFILNNFGAEYVYTINLSPIEKSEE